MTTRDLAMTTVGVVAVAASVAAGLTTWLLVTAPVTVAMAIESRDAEPLLEVALKALYQAVTQLVRYLYQRKTTMPLEMRRPYDPARLSIGLLIVALGVALLLDRAGVIDAFGRSNFGRSNFWPVVIIVVGLVKLANRPEHGPRQGGWWVFLGVWLLLNDMRLLRFRDSWPLFLVAIGISIVWNQIVPHRPRAPEKVE
jgi:hypothetical protein